MAATQITWKPGRLYDQLWRRAAVGPDAVALIQRVAAELRDRSITSSSNASEFD